MVPRMGHGEYLFSCSFWSIHRTSCQLSAPPSMVCGTPVGFIAAPLLYHQGRDGLLLSVAYGADSCCFSWHLEPPFCKPWRLFASRFPRAPASLLLHFVVLVGIEASDVFMVTGEMVLRLRGSLLVNCWIMNEWRNLAAPKICSAGGWPCLAFKFKL